jgi:hypothetical protein
MAKCEVIWCVGQAKRYLHSREVRNQMGVTRTLHLCVLSHSIQVDANVDGLLDGLEIASRDLRSR